MKKKHILAMDDKQLDKAIKISGTQYDRKRKLKDNDIEKAKKLFSKKHKTLEEIALKFGVDVRTIRYHLDTTYRQVRIQQARPKTRVVACKKDYKKSFSDRVAYKRQLVARGRVSI